MHRIFILIFLLEFINFNKVSAQISPYDKVDSIMRQYSEKIKSADELYKIVYYIRNTFDVDSLRLRASFIWITENISYDIEGFKKEDPRASMLNYVIKNKKAVCGGYAELLMFFCDAFNIESEIVYGTARAGKRDIDISRYNLRNNHAWNAIKINNNWRLIDPTWAAGSVDDIDADEPKFYKDYKELYYFTPPEKMIFNHFPTQFKHQYLARAILKEKFKKWPLFTSAFLGEKIIEIHPDTSVIKAKVGDTVLIRLKTNSSPIKVYLQALNFEKADYSGDAIRNGDWLEFRYPVKNSGNYIAYIGFQNMLFASPAFAAYKFEVMNTTGK